MRVLKFLKNILPVVLVPVVLGSCRKMLETDAGDVLEEKNMYRDVFDADAAVLGVYGKFMNLAERYVVLNELRADLMAPTANADEYQKQLSEHNVSESSPYANPRPFYEVILNCNDVLYHLDGMLRDKKLKEDQYAMRYSDIAALRSWVYLQLGIQYGKVPYITAPLSTAAELESINRLPRIGLTALIDSLQKTVEALPTREPYSATASLVTTVDGYKTNKFFINKKVLLAELYLWQGQYNKAARQYKEVMETGTGQLYNYRMTGLSAGDNDDLAVWYKRYREQDETQIIDNNTQGWRSIFARNDDALFNYEWLWYLPFDSRFQPVNPFINLFSNRGGHYKVKPSVAAMEAWNSQKQKNDFPFDARGPVFSYRQLDGQPVIMKYLYNYLTGTGFAPANLFDKGGKWFLYRAASLHLGFAEAANRDNQPAVAYALVNQGMTTVPNRITSLPAPYDFDARKTDNPSYTGDWALNVGLRGRANLYSQKIDTFNVLQVEDGIINESGLELAYEGRRWSDLLRVARRRNDPAFLADKVYTKLQKENNPQAGAARARLMDPEKWYLPFKWQ
ncbi:RagB/SusD family nutrient uptake outer membrane protein [Paraflavisolibacter sp. H34]|uniref:RagB/SusD family nutrient uptake outer membrane protein n=1 Tax=Huijunlia imazamoxiresistens TaxID=3127457 RepID=UPI0030198D59